MIIKTSSAEETQKFGQKLARSLRGGEIIGLTGELGSGKTTFVKGLAKGLGIRELVTSPTFVLLREYPTSPKLRTASPNPPVIQSSNHLILVHIDLYRLKLVKEIESLGLSDYLGKQDKICVIEWAEKMKSLLKKIKTPQIWVKINYVNENTREIKIFNS